jgi:hypothetical protein
MKPMYWPDDSPPKRRKYAGRAAALLLTLAAAVLAAVFLNGWWPRPRSNSDPEAESNGVVIVETVAMFPLDESQPIYEPPPTPVPVKNASNFALPRGNARLAAGLRG